MSLPAERSIEPSTDKTSDEWHQQLDFYAGRADRYITESWGAAEHDWPLAVLLGYMSIAKPASVLDVGAGSGRALHRADGVRCRTLGRFPHRRAP